MDPIHPGKPSRGSLILPIIVLLAPVIAGSDEPEPGFATAVPRQWRVMERSFTARERHSRQPLAVRFTVTFRGPDNAVYQVPGFWDGGQTWKVRFMPDRPGEWRFETRAVEGKTLVMETRFDSGVVHGGEKARRVDVDIRGIPELRLYVDDAGDGSSYDHADWADARILSADGTATPLEALTPLEAEQGYRSLTAGANLHGGKMRIADRVFTHGLATHAASRIVYRLPANAVRFQAWVGVDALVGKHGSVRFRVVCPREETKHVGRRDPGLDRRRGTFFAAPAAGDNPLFRHGGILRVSPDRRHLVYTDGTPFYWLGDTWWFCPSDLMPIDGSSNPAIPSAYRRCLAVRKRQGFTVVQMNFLDRIGGKSAYADFGQTRTIDIAYWRTVDRYFALANAAGIIPVVGMGWCGRPLCLDDWKTLWRYLIARYGAGGVGWLICGEYNLKQVPDRRIADTMKLGAFIKQLDPWHRALTIHPWYFRGDRRQAWREPWYDFIMLQGAHGPAPPLRIYAEARGSSPVRPVLEGECAYEGIHSFTAADVRNRAWRAVMAGCFGYTYGSHGLWYPNQSPEDRRFKEWGTPTPWWIALERPGAEHLGCMRRILERVPWPLMAPESTRIGLAEFDALRPIVDLVRRFDRAVSANAMWCKLCRSPNSLPELTEIELHPTGKGPRATLTYPPIVLPALAPDETLQLVFAVGLGPDIRLDDPKFPADGVFYTVEVNGKRLLREPGKSKNRRYHSLDLTPFAGREATIVLGVEAGKNANYDHARFRAPVIVRSPRGSPRPLESMYAAAPRPKPLIASAGPDVILVYFQAVEGKRWTYSLSLPGPRSAWRASWQDPRTAGVAPCAFSAASDTDGNTVVRPRPPDARDWVLLLRRRP